MRRKRLIYMMVILFMGINLLLNYLDHDGKIPKKAYVEQWSATFEMDMYESIDKQGVLSSVNEQHIYFDKNRGSFQEFLVDEGELIDTGDAVYTYAVHDYVEMRTYLESEIDKINGEIAAIEQAIATMSFYQVPQTNIIIEREEEEDITITPEPPVEADYMKEQYLAEKEKELAQKNAERESVRAQLAELEATGDTITVESPYQGEVTTISEELGDPLITVRDMELHVKGELNEQERVTVEQDMPVEVTFLEKEVVLQGSIENISDTPKATPIKSSSVYPFNVAFTEEIDTEELLPGYHATIEIIMKESNDATAVLNEHISNGELWIMTNKGKLINQEIQTGIQMNNIWEVTRGAEPDEWLAVPNQEKFKSGSTFITPLNWKQIKWRKLTEFENISWKKQFVIGILSR
ncbi:efflux RND transporter periplasmic adaptor subunit [Virgibacillus byunsanensis]|uniref:Efflux RND transporter periplasmic adaptor subunit n=1 Tax=Virgibacillus byunsanensis TaxID=570945 RepID=A0ABW3LL44_9BACI